MKLATDPGEFVTVALTLLADREVRRALRGVLLDGLAPTHVTVSAFAARYSVSPRLVSNWLRDGLPAKRFGRLVRIPLAEGDAWIAGREDP